MFEEVVVGVHQSPGKRVMFSADERLAMMADATEGIARVAAIG